MPVEWVTRPEGAPASSGAFSHAAGDPPLAEVHLWPHRSLPKRGFAFFIGVTFLLLLLPLYPAIGSPVLWGLLPFLMGTLWLLYYLLAKSYRDAEILEELRLWHDAITLERHEPQAPVQDWQATPHWVEVKIHETGGPVANYITLRGGTREVEIGSFLSEKERLDLYAELSRYLPMRG